MIIIGSNGDTMINSKLPSISFACLNIALLEFSILLIDHSFLGLIFELRSIHFVFRILFVFDLGIAGPILSIFVYAIPMPKRTLYEDQRAEKRTFSSRNIRMGVLPVVGVEVLVPYF